MKHIKNKIDPIFDLLLIRYSHPFSTVLTALQSRNRAWQIIPASGILKEIKMACILKRRNFARWQTGEKLPDTALCKAAQEMKRGLIDADLGGFLYKKRVARAGFGKSGGYRTLLSARIGSHYVFLHGFPKNDKENITQDEKKALQFAGKIFLELSAKALLKALQSGVLLEVHCEQDH